MQIRRLKPDEYGLLETSEGLEPIHGLTPENSVVIGAFDGDKLVGRMAAIFLPHVEVAEIHPEYRNRTLAFRLEKAVVDVLKCYGACRAFAFAMSPKIKDYLHRLDYEDFAEVLKKEL